METISEILELTGSLVEAKAQQESIPGHEYASAYGTLQVLFAFLILGEPSKEWVIEELKKQINDAYKVQDKTKRDSDIPEQGEEG